MVAITPSIGPRWTIVAASMAGRSSIAQPATVTPSPTGAPAWATRPSPPQFLDADLLVEHRADLLQREAEVLQRHSPVEPAQLADLVRPVAGHGVDVRGPEQADRVVVAQHPYRHTAVSGEISNVHH